MAQVLTLAVSCICMSFPVYAQIASDRIAIGGVGPGCTPAYVQGVYGEPLATATQTGGVSYNYNGGFIVGFDEGQQQVVAATCTTDNLSTPDGVSVGMEASVLSRTYGTADHIYNYNDKTLYVYDGTSGGRLAFDVQNFYIISISARQ